MDMAAMYQTIAAGGFRMPLRSIREVVDARAMRSNATRWNTSAR